MIYDVTVLGAGPAGIMAALKASQTKKNIILLERNSSIGKKLLITGNKRCNITNSAPLEDFMQKFGKRGSFFRSAFQTFSNEDLIDFFKVKGLNFKTEDKGRLFPVADSAKTVVYILEQYLKESNVKISYKARLLNLKPQNENFKLYLNGNRKIISHKVVLATGGASYPSTGSTGEVFPILKRLGHDIKPLKPGLIPLKIGEKFIQKLQGITLEDAGIMVKQNHKKILQERGNLIFTHFGVSGPVILDSSSRIVDLFFQNGKHGEENQVKLFLDLKPDLSREELERDLLIHLKEQGKTYLKNLLKNYLPQGMIPLVTHLAGVDPEKKENQMTRKERNSLLELIKSFPLTLTGYLPLEKAMVTCGGVSRNEIDPHTMESRLISGLYFAGEIIEGCAPSGGYNLQQAFSTGYLSGISSSSS
jgi:predicted Rossmann fold flavoprotein